MSGRRPSALRCLVVWAAATVLLGSVATFCVTELLGTADQPTDRAVAAEQAVVLVTSAAGAWASVHVWALGSLTVVDLLRGSTVRGDGPVAAGAWTTGTVRRLTLLACGVAVSAGAALPSYAAEPPRAEPTSGLAVLDGLPYPDRTSTGATDEPAVGHDSEPVEVRHEATRLAPVPRAHPSEARTHRPRLAGVERTVRPGDTLWAIASDLTDHADATTVARRVDELHRANRSVVGDDPDLIHPGQRLRVRPSTDRRTATPSTDPSSTDPSSTDPSSTDPSSTDPSSTADRSQEGPR